jgi:DNA modification methylase
MPSDVTYRRVRLEDLHEDPANARLHPDENLADIRASLKEFGQVEPLVVQKNGKVIGGNGRLKVMRDLGWTECDVAELDVSDMKATALGIALNRAGERAEWDTDVLGRLLKEVEASEPDFAQALDELAEAEGIAGVEPGEGGDEFNATPQEGGPTRTNPGELWVIGEKHRLLVGDCTHRENIDRLMGSERVGLCFTSPPYAQQRDYGENAKEKVQDWNGLMCGAFAHLPMTDDGQVLVNLGLIHREGEWVPYWEHWIGWMREQGWRRFGWYVWDQGPGMPGDWNGRLAPAHEFIWHFCRESVRAAKARECKHAGEAHGGKGQRGANGVVKERSAGTDPVQSHAIHDSVFRVNRQGAQHGADGHPAPYPIGLPTIAIASWPGDVYDPFLGSGTTLIAAHRLNRRCYGCEIEPRYADVILKRAEAEGLTCTKAD